MSVQRLPEIEKYLLQKDVQERILESIQSARSNVTVTISRAANLFGFSESQLREWEKKGLLTSDRTALAQDGKGHRQYTTNELNKLAVFKELFQIGGYAPSDIPPDFNAIWEHIEREQQNHISSAQTSHVVSSASNPPASIGKKHIDQRVQLAEQEVFWRYFTSQALRLSLMLICEDIPETVAGLILPLQTEIDFVRDPIDLPMVNEALIGWLNPNGSFNTFLDASPSFEHPSDFRIERLLAVGEEGTPADQTIIVLQRKARSLNLNLALVQTVRRLLAEVYTNAPQWKSAFEYGMRDYLYQATNFSGSTDPSDEVLDKLMELAIQLGGTSTQHPGHDRWQFCCLLLPQDASLPLQKRSLVIRAQSERSPYKVNIHTVTINNPGLSLRAYQSGNVIYRPDMSARDLVIAYQEHEQKARSTIAIPIAGEDGLSIAVLYLASNEAQAFPLEDQRVLRLIGTMVEELLLTYQARQQVSGKRTDLIECPGIVDPTFKPFLTENDFISDLEKLLKTVQAKDESEYTPEEEVSFIAIDIDDQSALATKYGDLVARNLSKEVGTRLRGLLNLFTNPGHQRLYHVNADRYYLLLDGMLLDEALKKAEQLRAALAGDYLIDTQKISSERSSLPENMLKLSNITVRVGVPTYKFRKLIDILRRFDSATAVYEVRTVITKAIDEALKQGRRDGGDAIISWDPDAWGYRKWTSIPLS